MKVLLLNPEYPETFWNFKYVLKFIGKKAAFPPLGLLTVAAMLPAGWQKRLIDLNVRSLADADLKWADLIFIGAMLIQQDSARRLIARGRECGKRIVAGGPAFTAQPEKFSGVDHLVLNEAEITLPLFLTDLEAGCPKPCYRSDQRPDIRDTPIPLWPLIDLRDYATMAIQFSRGCPFNCEFCDIVIMNGRRPRVKTPAQMRREFEALYQAGWRRSVFIVDDNFIGNRRAVKELLGELIEWQKTRHYPFTLLTEASIDLAQDRELLRLMSKANFFKVFLGLETPNNASLRECGKLQNTGRNLAEAVRTIHAHGIQVMGGFIVGFDHDTETIFESQINFIQQVGVVTAMVGMLTALPRTRLWHRLRAEGRLVEEASGNNTDGLLNFVPAMGREQLLSGYCRILTTIYSSRCYYKRIQVFLATYTPTVHTRLGREDILAFTKSLWRIGILSRARFLYWRLLVSTLFRKWRALPMAIEMAIHGLHFEKLARQVEHNVRRHQERTPARQTGIA